MPPINTPIYGFAYSVNDDTKYNRLMCKPLLGEILDYEDDRLKNINPKRYYSDYVFVPYKKNSKEFKKSGIVDIDSRMYADTLEEAIEMYNELVDKRINKLQEMIKESIKDKMEDIRNNNKLALYKKVEELISYSISNNHRFEWASILTDLGEEFTIKWRFKGESWRFDVNIEGYDGYECLDCLVDEMYDEIKGKIIKVELKGDKRR